MYTCSTGNLIQNMLCVCYTSTSYRYLYTVHPYLYYFEHLCLL
jgi:hypothetical protein